MVSNSRQVLWTGDSDDGESSRNESQKNGRRFQLLLLLLSLLVNDVLDVTISEEYDDVAM